jgi:hypothetical protein
MSSINTNFWSQQAIYKRLSSEIIRRQVPDFPSGISGVGLGMNRRDVVWRISPQAIDRQQIGTVKPPTMDIFEKELHVPIDVVFTIGSAHRPVVPTLNALIDVARSTVDQIRAHAPSRPNQ